MNTTTTNANAKPNETSTRGNSFEVLREQHERMEVARNAVISAAREAVTRNAIGLPLDDLMQELDALLLCEDREREAFRRLLDVGGQLA